MEKNQVKVWTKADGEGNISKVVDFGKSKVEIPVNNDGSAEINSMSTERFCVWGMTQYDWGYFSGEVSITEPDELDMEKAAEGVRFGCVVELGCIRL